MLDKIESEINLTYKYYLKPGVPTFRHIKDYFCVYKKPVIRIRKSDYVYLTKNLKVKNGLCLHNIRIKNITNLYLSLNVYDNGIVSMLPGSLKIKSQNKNYFRFKNYLSFKKISAGEIIEIEFYTRAGNRESLNAFAFYTCVYKDLKGVVFNNNFAKI
jgi:hypothetical protein